LANLDNDKAPSEQEVQIVQWSASKFFVLYVILLINVVKHHEF
jgi:hypothetical protein